MLRSTGPLQDRFLALTKDPDIWRALKRRALRWRDRHRIVGIRVCSMLDCWIQPCGVPCLTIYCIWYLRACPCLRSSAADAFPRNGTGLVCLFSGLLRFPWRFEQKPIVILVGNQLGSIGFN